MYDPWKRINVFIPTAPIEAGGIPIGIRFTEKEAWNDIDAFRQDPFWLNAEKMCGRELDGYIIVYTVVSGELLEVAYNGVERQTEAVLRRDAGEIPARI